VHRGGSCGIGSSLNRPPSFNAPNIVVAEADDAPRLQTIDFKRRRAVYKSLYAPCRALQETSAAPMCCRIGALRSLRCLTGGFPRPRQVEHRAGFSFGACRAPLAEQARKGDYKSSDECGHAGKQHNVTQGAWACSRLPLLPPRAGRSWFRRYFVRSRVDTSHDSSSAKKRCKCRERDLWPRVSWNGWEEMWLAPAARMLAAARTFYVLALAPEFER
jgi:hypothetical protein